MRRAIRERLRLRYMERLVANPRGRAFLLKQVAEAEDSDETRVFEHLEAHVDDPELRRMIRRHAEDEQRHARLLFECLDRLGIEVGEIPPELSLLHRLDAALGGFFAKPVRGPREVMEAYLVLQVIEERATTRFPMFERLLRPYDPETADVFVAVARDEERHLRYCHAISRRYAPDPDTHRRTLERFRSVEARVFAANSRANLLHTLDHGLVQMGRPEQAFWRAFARLTALLPGDQDRTPYWGQTPAHAA